MPRDRNRLWLIMSIAAQQHKRTAANRYSSTDGQDGVPCRHPILTGDVRLATGGYSQVAIPMQAGHERKPQSKTTDLQF